MSKKSKMPSSARTLIDPEDFEEGVPQDEDSKVKATFKKRSEAAHKAVRTREANKAAMKKEFDASRQKYLDERAKIRAEVAKDALSGDIPIVIPPPTNELARRWYTTPEPHRELVADVLLNHIQTFRKQAADARARKLNHRGARMDEAADAFVCALNALGFRLEGK